MIKELKSYNLNNIKEECDSIYPITTIDAVKVNENKTLADFIQSLPDANNYKVCNLTISYPCSTTVQESATFKVIVPLDESNDISINIGNYFDEISALKGEVKLIKDRLLNLD